MNLHPQSGPTWFRENSTPLKRRKKNQQEMDPVRNPHRLGSPPTVQGSGGKGYLPLAESHEKLGLCLSQAEGVLIETQVRWVPP